MHNVNNRRQHCTNMVLADSGKGDVLRRRLVALGHFDPEGVVAAAKDDWFQLRRLVAWLENQKVRSLDIDKRKWMTQQDNREQWNRQFQRYLQDLGCPKLPTGDDQLLWLVGHAVKAQYAVASAAGRADGDGRRDARPGVLDAVDVNSEEFKSRVSELAAALKVTPHPDHLVTFHACCLVVADMLSSSAATTGKGAGQPVDVEEHPMGVPPGLRGEAGLARALKILRLLHLKELRELQDEINNTIERVQSLTANPKTDTRLGKVGR